MFGKRSTKSASLAPSPRRGAPPSHPIPLPRGRGDQGILLRAAAVAFVPMLLTLTGCTVGPDYVAPVPDVPAAFTAPLSEEDQTDAVAPTVYEAGGVEMAWWQQLGDPILDDLVDRALKENHDLRVARANVLRARALLGEGRLERYPIAQVSGSVTEQTSSAATVGTTEGSEQAGTSQTYYSVSLDAGWELDFFGRVRRSVEARAAEAERAVADQRFVAVTVAAEVARTYVELRGAQYQLEVAEQNATNQKSTFELTQILLEGGRGTDLDLARATAQLQQTLAGLPVLRARIAGAIHRLGVLVGEPPDALRGDLLRAVPLPSLPSDLSVGDPADLLRRRPDIQSAERDLAALTARIGVATADLFPRVTLGGSLGFLATDAGDLLDGDSRQTSIGPFLSWAAFDLGRVRRRIDATEAEALAALAVYERTVLDALEETESALVAYQANRERRARLAIAANASSRAAELARVRYRYGADSFLSVLDAERRLLEAQDAVARSAADTALSYVALYKALGGGWQRATDLISTDPEVEAATEGRM